MSNNKKVKNNKKIKIIKNTFSVFNNFNLCIMKHKIAHQKTAKIKKFYRSIDK